VVAYSDFGQRTIKHHALGLPPSARVVNMNFIEEEKAPGWMGLGSSSVSRELAFWYSFSSVTGVVNYMCRVCAVLLHGIHH
jgi:hypothetical protein